MSALPECLACGACCFSTLETYVRVTGDDYARLGELADALVRFVGNRAYLRVEGGRCAALVVERASRRLVCRAYEHRPDVCRDLERGSPACLAERERKAEAVQTALDPTRAGAP